MGWLQYYDMIYGLDEIERPDDRILEDDEKCDAWWSRYREDMKKRLIKHHKDMGTKNIDQGVPKPRKGFVYGNG